MARPSVLRQSATSSAVIFAGAAQADGYPAYRSVAGAVFPLPHSAKTEWLLSVTVASDGPGVELYTVDGGTQRIFEVLQTQLAQLCRNGVCATQRAQASGDLREASRPDGSAVITSGGVEVTSVVRTATGGGIYVFPFLFYF